MPNQRHRQELLLIMYEAYRRTRQTLWGGRTDANPKLSLNDI